MTISRTCNKCGEVKPTSDFYGRCNSCKVCDLLIRRQWYLNNLERIKKEKREYGRERYKDPEVRKRISDYGKSEAGKLTKKRTKDRHADRESARKKLGNAVALGKIIPWPVCAIHSCEDKPEAHHPDYSRPLDVVWLCPKHHTDAHVLARKGIAKVSLKKSKV